MSQCILGVVLHSAADAAQESAAAWNADDDAHEDKSEIDEQLNCVRRINQSIHFVHIATLRHSFIFWFL
jgi:hypothetical protein